MLSKYFPKGKMMDFVTFLLSLSFIILTGFHVFRSYSRPCSSPKLPPGPKSLPIIGNILQLGSHPHIALKKLSVLHGPLMFLKLGCLNTIVVSSPNIAKEVLQKHDHVLSNRFIPVAGEVHEHHKISIGYLPVGRQWRNIRKICKEQMFSMPRLNASQRLRQEKFRKLHEHVNRHCAIGEVMNIGEIAFVTSLNLMSSTLFSVDVADFDSDSTQEMKDTIRGMIKVIGTPNLADFFPVLKVLDPQGIRRRSEFYFGKLLAMFDDIIKEKLQAREAVPESQRPSDLLEALLDICQGIEYDLSLDATKHFLLDLFGAGTDSSAVAVEWVMTELLRNPVKMSKTQNEIRALAGKNEQIQETDIQKLPYLRAVIKETLRLHPPLPFLIPHQAGADTEINGYIVPENAQILVNLCAIGRDPSVWPNPDSFEPERFLDSDVDYRGHDFELIPFGSGRRMCPGLPLAHRMVHLMVASLIHCFDWKLEHGMRPQELDISDKIGLSLQRADPLKAIPIKFNL